MSAGVSRPVRRLAAVGLALAVLLALAGALEPALRRLLTIGAEIEAGRERLGQLTALARAAPGSGGALEAEERAIGAALFLDGESEAIQLANLQAGVRGLAERAGIRLRSIQTMAPVKRDDMSLAGVRLAMQAPIEALQRLLLAIDQHRPLLMLDGLEIAPIEGGPTGARSLQIDMRLLANVRPARGSAP